MPISAPRTYPSVGYAQQIFLGFDAVWDRLNTAVNTTGIRPEEVTDATLIIFNRDGVVLEISEIFDWAARRCDVSADMLVALSPTDSSNALWWQLAVNNGERQHITQGGRLFVKQHGGEIVGTPTAEPWRIFTAIKNVTEDESFKLWNYPIQPPLRIISDFAVQNPYLLIKIMGRQTVTVKTIEDITDARRATSMNYTHRPKRAAPTSVDQPEYDHQFWQIDAKESNHHGHIWWHTNTGWIRVIPHQPQHEIE